MCVNFPVILSASRLKKSTAISWNTSSGLMNKLYSLRMLARVRSHLFNQDESHWMWSDLCVFRTYVLLWTFLGYAYSLYSVSTKKDRSGIQQTLNKIIVEALNITCRCESLANLKIGTRLWKYFARFSF